MGSEKLRRKSIQRSRLSDITNTALSIRWTNCLEDNVPPLQIANGAQLQKEIASLEKTLAEKEAIIKAQRQELERVWSKYSQMSRQNGEIIQQNGQLYKDLMQAREKVDAFP
eukprot:c16412_g1_i3 orf=132-467(-)